MQYPKCNHKNPEGAKFCMECGEKISLPGKNIGTSVVVENKTEMKEKESKDIKQKFKSGLRKITKIKDVQIPDEVKDQIKKVANEAFKKTGIMTREAAFDEKKFIRVIGIAYKLLPMPIRLVVKKDLFKSLMIDMRELLFKDENINYKELDITGSQVSLTSIDDQRDKKNAENNENAGELPKETLKDSLYSKKPEDFTSEFQRLLNGIKSGHFASLEGACELASNFKSPSDKQAIEVLIEALKFDDPYLVSSAAKALGHTGDKEAVPALIAAFDKGGYLSYKNRAQIVEGRSVFGSYRDKIQGLCEALWMIGDSEGLEVAKLKLYEVLSEAKMTGVKVPLEIEKIMLHNITSGYQFSEVSTEIKGEVVTKQDTINKIQDFKSKFKKSANEGYTKLLDKTKSVREDIAQGKYSKILNNEFIKSSLSWFRVSDARLRLVTYIGWSTLLFALLSISEGNFMPLLSGAPVLAGFIFYSLGAVSGPVTKILSMINEIPFAWVVTVPLITIPSYIFGWPAEQLYSRVFYKFTCLGMGLAHAERGNYDKAIKELEMAKVSKKDIDGRAILHATLADAHAEVGRFDNAIAQYEQAIQYKPEDILLKEGFGYCYTMKNQYNEALKIFREVLNADPENITAHWGISRCYLEMEMYDDALNYIKQGITLEPQNAVGHSMMAEAYLGLGDEENALKEARLVSTLNPAEEIAKSAKDTINIISGEYVEVSSSEGQKEIGKEEMSTEDITSATKVEKEDKDIKDFRSMQMPNAVNWLIYCTNPECNKELPPDSTFCGYCGTKI